MPITEKQREAARINGSRSRGPVTTEGKKASRRNALKHGLTGQGTVLPDELRQEVEAELSVFEKKLKPRDEFEQRLVQQAALATVRWIRLARAELTHTADRSLAAHDRWDRQRDDRVAHLAALLDDEPAEAVRQLRGFTEGCDFLADAWDDLRATLDHLGFLDDASAQRALRLLGLDRTPNAHSPSWQFELWKAILALQFLRDPESVIRKLHTQAPADRVRGWLPAPDAALATLRALLDEQFSEYDLRGDHLWTHRDAPDRASAPDRDLFDPSPEYVRLHRYLLDNERSRRRALSELASLRSRSDAAPPSPAEPTQTAAPPVPTDIVSPPPPSVAAPSTPQPATLDHQPAPGLPEPPRPAAPPTTSPVPPTPGTREPSAPVAPSPFLSTFENEPDAPPVPPLPPPISTPSPDPETVPNPG